MTRGATPARSRQARHRAPAPGRPASRSRERPTETWLPIASVRPTPWRCDHRAAAAIECAKDLAGRRRIDLPKPAAGQSRAVEKDAVALGGVGLNPKCVPRRSKTIYPGIGLPDPHAPAITEIARTGLRNQRAAGCDPVGQTPRNGFRAPDRIGRVEQRISPDIVHMGPVGLHGLVEERPIRPHTALEQASTLPSSDSAVSKACVSGTTSRPTSPRTGRAVRALTCPWSFIQP